MIYLKVCVIGKNGVGIPRIAHEEHVCELELGFGNAVIGSDRKVSKRFIVVGYTR